MICESCKKHIDKYNDKYGYITYGGERLCYECFKKYKKVKNSL